jgi:SAM-dependent methyltransferase
VTRADLHLRYSALDRPRVLDLGAGGAPWSVAVLSGNAAATAVVNDLPGVIDVARRKLDERELLDRVELRPGDFHTVDIEVGAYDLVVLGHVCRAEGLDGTRRLIERAHAALAPGGRLLLSDYFVDRQRSLASHALMMGVTMMASTRQGLGLNYGDVAATLRDTGFEGVRLIEPIGYQQLFVATRRRTDPQEGAP